MRRTSSVLVLFMLAACKGESATDAGASASLGASASAGAQAAPDVPLTRGKWWDVAKKSRVYTEERRVDADNALRLLQQPTRDLAVRALDDMAKQTPDGDGLRAASQLARDAQEKVDDTRNLAPRNAIATCALIVLGGMVARASTEHPDVASLAPVMAAIREMPMPHLDKSDGRVERGVLEQEMRTILDEKTMRSLLAGAPSPKKSL